MPRVRDALLFATGLLAGVIGCSGDDGEGARQGAEHHPSTTEHHPIQSTPLAGN